MQATDDRPGDDPLLNQTDVAGLYPPDAAVAASAATACDPGSGPIRIDD